MIACGVFHFYFERRKPAAFFFFNRFDLYPLLKSSRTFATTCFFFFMWVTALDGALHGLYRTTLRFSPFLFSSSVDFPHFMCNSNTYVLVVYIYIYVYMYTTA